MNGKEAVEAVRLALAASEPYDFICLDIMMPEMGGQQALRHIRALEAGQGLLSANAAKIVMTTALADMKNVCGAYAGLCDAYLVKPIAKIQLAQELRKLGLLQ